MPHTLLPSQQNDVFQAVQKAGFDPADFEWKQTLAVHNHDIVPELVHKPSGFRFLFEWQGQHVAVFTPGEESPDQSVGAGPWLSQLAWVQKWLKNLKREYYAPDFWGELERQRELAAATEPGDAEDNTPLRARRADHHRSTAR